MRSIFQQAKELGYPPVKAEWLAKRAVDLEMAGHESDSALKIAQDDLRWYLDGETTPVLRKHWANGAGKHLPSHEALANETATAPQVTREASVAPDTGRAIDGTEYRLKLLETGLQALHGRMQAVERDTLALKFWRADLENSGELLHHQLQRLWTDLAGAEEQGEATVAELREGIEACHNEVAAWGDRIKAGVEKIAKDTMNGSQEIREALRVWSYDLRARERELAGKVAALVQWQENTGPEVERLAESIEGFRAAEREAIAEDRAQRQKLQSVESQLVDLRAGVSLTRAVGNALVKEATRLKEPVPVSVQQPVRVLPKSAREAAMSPYRVGDPRRDES
jgi:hypothetical protein